MVNNADALLKLSKRVLGSTIVNGIVKRTFFKHFCAGEGCSVPTAPMDAFVANRMLRTTVDCVALAWVWYPL